MRFDVYRISGRGKAEFVIDVQADILAGLASRIVIPLVAAEDAQPPFRELYPVFEILESNYVLVTHELAGVPKWLLQRPVANLADRRDEITRALDRLFTGF
jgi:toxin CcdB